MRPRIRSMKPEIHQDEELWDLEQDTGLAVFRAYTGLWGCSDREGRFEWRPRMLKSNILPYWDGDFEEVLSALVSIGKVIKYEVNGRYYGWCPNMKKHNSFNAREPESVLPGPPAETTHVRARAERRDARADRTGPDGTGLVADRTGTGAPERERRTDGLPAIPGLQRVISPSGVARVYELPDIDPPDAYLEEAVMAGVSREQAASTWNHYRTNGLPERGVQRLYPWLIKQALERQARQARAPKSGTNTSPRDEAMSWLAEAHANAKAREAS